MRDLIVTLIVFSVLPFIFKLPYVGLLLWSWISYMNPHRLGWGFAYNFPFAYIIAIVTILAVLLSKEKNRIPMTGLVALWLIYLAWMGITTIFAIDPDTALVQFIKVAKIQFMTFLTLLLFQSKERIIQLVWVIALSVAFFGVKGGIFTILHGGGERVWGPPGSFIADNNHLAVALLMVIPLLIYLRSICVGKWVRLALLVSTVLVAVSVVGSYSRGALLASVGMAIFLWLKSPKKLLIAIVSITIFSGLFFFMPEKWHDRMGTISTYEEDNSAQGRFEAWEVSFNVANDRIFGGGLDLWSPEVFAVYSHGYEFRAAHSIYFSVLGEHGWIGLFLFVSILISAWRVAQWVVNVAKGLDDLKWATGLARMIQVSLIAYASGGAFLSLAYFDLPWHLIAIVVLLQQQVKRHLETTYGKKTGSTFPQRNAGRPLRLGK